MIRPQCVKEANALSHKYDEQGVQHSELFFSSHWVCISYIDQSESEGRP
jgi:hypothetical protein